MHPVDNGCCVTCREGRGGQVQICMYVVHLLYNDLCTIAYVKIHNMLLIVITFRLKYTQPIGQKSHILIYK